MFEKILDFQACQNPDAPAVRADAGDVSYQKFARDVSQMTSALLLEDLPPGVVFIGPVYAPLHWVLTLALERLGHTTICGSMDDVGEVVRPAVVITTDRRWSAKCGERVLVSSENWIRQAFSQKPSAKRSSGNPDDVVRIILSSGTTGARKQISITRRVLDERIGRPLVGFGAELCYLQSIGLDTIGAFQNPLSTWCRGGLVMMPTRITEETFRSRKPTYMTMSPTRLRELLPIMAAVLSPSDRVHVRVVGSAIPPQLLREAMRCQGLELSVSYGSTEVGNIASCPADIALRRRGAVGYVSPWVDLELVDEDGRPVLAGKSGDIRIRGDGVVINDPDKQSGVDQQRGGWFYSNDVGHMDDDGVLVIDGRRDDVINLGGLKISATRVEETVLACEGVEDVAVVALPMVSGRWTMFAAIMPMAQGYDSEKVKRDVLQLHQAPLRLIDLPEIPRNAMGKIVRSAVRAAIIAKETASE